MKLPARYKHQKGIDHACLVRVDLLTQDGNRGVRLCVRTCRLLCPFTKVVPIVAEPISHALTGLPWAPLESRAARLAPFQASGVTGPRGHGCFIGCTGCLGRTR